MAEKIRDLKQVGVSKKASEQIKELVENYEYFHNEQDVYRLAVAIAVAAGDKPSESIMKSDMPTKWRVEDDAGDSTGDGQRLEDKDGNLKAFMTAMVPEAKSVRSSVIFIIVYYNII